MSVKYLDLQAPRVCLPFLLQPCKWLEFSLLFGEIHSRLPVYLLFPHADRFGALAKVTWISRPASVARATDNARDTTAA